jgi:hypothetical protein
MNEGRNAIDSPEEFRVHAEGALEVRDRTFVLAFETVVVSHYTARFRGIFVDLSACMGQMTQVGLSFLHVEDVAVPVMHYWVVVIVDISMLLVTLHDIIEED